MNDGSCDRSQYGPYTLNMSCVQSVILTGRSSLADPHWQILIGRSSLCDPCGNLQCCEKKRAKVLRIEGGKIIRAEGEFLVRMLPVDFSIRFSGRLNNFVWLDPSDDAVTS